jgi:cytochrome P450
LDLRFYRESLPDYFSQVERLHAPFWMGTPHFSTEDHVYSVNGNEMYIPKDTVVILNCFTLHHDEQRYPEPFKFNPDRYAGDDLNCMDSSKLSDPTKRDHWAFGAG